VTDIAPDVKLTFHNAGHILGSAVTHFHIGDGLYNVAFSGDIHYDDTRLFNGAVNDFPRVETLVLESTYGGRNDYQTDQEDSERKLKRVINETYERGGKVLIPAFAVGRSQEMMLVLEEAMRKGEIPEMPIHLDGMIWEATAIHTTYPSTSVTTSGTASSTRTRTRSSRPSSTTSTAARRSARRSPTTTSASSSRRPGWSRAAPSCPGSSTSVQTRTPR